MSIERFSGSNFSNRLSAFIFALSTCLVFVTNGHAQDVSQSAYIKPGSPTEDGHFGQSVFLGSTLLAAGASGEDAVYTFTKCQSTDWQKAQRLTHPSGQIGARFGQSIVGSRDRILVGAPSEDGDENGNNPGDYLNAGAVYSYVRNDHLLQSPERITPSNHAPGSRFGWSVDISGSGYMIVGAQEREHETVGRFAGAAYIFAANESGEWMEVEFLESPDPQYAERFGGAVQITDSWAFVGAKSSQMGGSAAVGSVYVYEKSESGWDYRQKLVPHSAAEGWNFGYAISLDDTRAAIGAIGATGSGGEDSAGNVYVYELADGSWAEKARIEAATPSAGAWFGGSVAIEKDLLTVGAFLDDVAPLNRAGSAHLFVMDDSEWSPVDRILPNNLGAGFEFGTSIDLRSGIVAVGAIGESSDGSSPDDSSLPGAGAVFLFSPSDWVFRSRFESCEPLASLKWH